MNQPPNHSVERTAFSLLTAALLAPVVAQGLWLPAAHFLGHRGSSATVTGAALLIALAVVVAQRLRPIRMLPLALGCVIAVGASAALLGLPGLVSLLGVTFVVSFAVRAQQSRLPRALDGLIGRHRVLALLYGVVAIVAVVSSARLSNFIGDFTRVKDQVIPGNKFLETHSCLTAYVQADRLAGERVPNLYEESRWHSSHGLAPRTEEERDPFIPFNLDYYAYPPPFLLAVAPLAPLKGDFPAQRALWFGLNGLLLAVGLWTVATWVEGKTSHRVLLLAPIFFGSLPILATLQIGNFQLATVMISILAMLAFHRNRSVLGGALLAFAILSKISPGILGILLLAQRRWRDAAWTAGFGVLLLALSVVVYGTDPLVSFVTYTLPRVSSGQAFAFMDDETFSILTNMSPFGLPFKLQLAGLTLGDPWVLGPRIGRVYTAVLVLLAVATGRARGDRRSQAVLWMSLVVLGALQSPFAPGYVTIALLWSITLLSMEVGGVGGALGLVALWLMTVAVLPVSIRAQAVFTVAQTFVTLGVPIGLVVRAILRKDRELH